MNLIINCESNDVWKIYKWKKKKFFYIVYCLIIFNREKNYWFLKIFDLVYKMFCVVYFDSVMGM